jgi:hypothetical protein
VNPKIAWGEESTHESWQRIVSVFDSLYGVGADAGRVLVGVWPMTLVPDDEPRLFWVLGPHDGETPTWQPYWAKPSQFKESDNEHATV